MTLGNNPCLKTQYALMKEMVAAVEKFALEQNISREEALEMTVSECHRTWNTSITPAKSTVP